MSLSLKADASFTEQNLVLLKELSFRWRKDLPLVLDIPELKISKGSKVFIKGSSGSGKTTLLNLIAGVLKPSTGQITVGGQSLSQFSGRQRDLFRADYIGFIFQMFNLIPYLSVLENVTLALNFSKARKLALNARAEEEARRLLQRLGLDLKLIVRRVTDLSIGQQQRVAAARALIGKPPLLIADEPTSALDTDTRETFIKLLFEECNEAAMTLLFVSHDGGLEHLFDYSLSLSEINQVPDVST